MKDIRLETERLVLRFAKESDFADVHAYASDEYETRFMTFGPNTEEDTRRYLREIIAQYSADPMTDYDFAVVLKSTGRRIGGINLILTEGGGATIGWIIAREYQHEGLMTEAAEKVLSFAFGELKLKYVEAVAASDNESSCGLMKKLGMKLSLTVPGGWIKKPAAGGGVCDEVHYRITAEEYSAHGADEPSLSYANGREAVKSGILGLFIGLAVIVPGISGSTVAIIFRLYDKLLYAIGNILRRFRKCALFLLPILAGAVVGFLGGFFSVRFLLDLLPFAVVALFAGLMFGAMPAVKDEIKGEKVTVPRALLFAAGFAIPVAFALVSTLGMQGSRSLDDPQFYDYIIFLLLGYAVAITQVVPGLSATALLMMFGYFTSIMESVSLTYWQSNPLVLLLYVCFGVGFLVGLVTFSKALTAIFARFRVPAFFTVFGMSLGSAVTMFFNPDIFAVYVGWSEGAPFALDVGLGVPLFVIGLVGAYLLVRYERRHSHKDKIS